jgi:hypothetical protein
LKPAPKEAFKGLLYLQSRPESFERVFTKAMAQSHSRNLPSVIKGNHSSSSEGGKRAGRARHR